MTRTRALAGFALALALTCAASAQTPAPDDTDCNKLPNRTAVYDCLQAHMQVRIIDLKNVIKQNDANEILVAVRNIADPLTKIYLVANHNSIVVATYPAALDRIEALIHSLDRPKPTYRLTFTVTDFDGSTKTGTRHYTLVAASGERSVLKQGGRIPVTTGSYKVTEAISETQNSYVDVGMNIDITAIPYAGGLHLSSKVEQSSVAEVSPIAPHDPVLHQSVITGESTLTLGKPLVLGTLDVPDSNKRMEISVVAETLP